MLARYPNRRRLLRAWAVGGLAPWAWLNSAHAGAQAEEDLADAVRNAMRAALRSDEPPEPVFADTPDRLAYLRWKIDMNQRLKQRKTELRTLQQREEFLQTLWYNAKRSGLDVSLVMGVIQVESNFRQHAISSAGARGFMQVMPFWTRVLGDGDPAALFHMPTNLRYGCVILRHYLEVERGDVFLALGRYNGSRGLPTYPNAVRLAQANWPVQA